MAAITLFRRFFKGGGSYTNLKIFTLFFYIKINLFISLRLLLAKKIMSKIIFSGKKCTFSNGRSSICLVDLILLDSNAQHNRTTSQSTHHELVTGHN